MSKIIIFLLFQTSINMLIFPFKIAYVNHNGEINKNSKEYNATHFGRDIFDMPLYTEIKIGNPSQSLKVILSSEFCGSFKIGNSTKCINSEEYLSNYNRNNSKDFNYTDRFKGIDLDFGNKNNGSTAVETIYAYSDIKLEKLIKYENVGFFLGSDTNDKLCGTIGFQRDDLICERIINITYYLKKRKYINNYKFILKYNTTEEGMYIIGSELKNIINDYNENKTFKRKMNMRKALKIIEINITEIKGENDPQSIQSDTKATFKNDFSLILGSQAYHDYIVNTTFKEYFKKGICFQKIFDKDPSYISYYKYLIIECDKEKFGENDIKKIPKLFLYTREHGSLNEFSFDYNDLFTETKYKYFFNIIFEKYKKDDWIFGKIFLKKYPINFDYESQTIEVYDYYYEEKHDKKDDGGNNGDNNDMVLYIVIAATLVIITGVVGYFLGKYINKMRKKRANELVDDYDYNAKTDNNEETNKEIINS